MYSVPRGTGLHYCNHALPVSIRVSLRSIFPRDVSVRNKSQTIQTVALHNDAEYMQPGPSAGTVHTESLKNHTSVLLQLHHAYLTRTRNDASK